MERLTTDTPQTNMEIEAEELCRKLGLDYYIKDSLRAEMERQHV